MDTPSRQVRFGLTVKFLAFALGMLAIVLAAGYAYFIRPTGEILQGALLTKGEALCRMIAFNVSFGVLTEDAEELRKNVAGVMDEEDILYVVIYAKDGSTILLEQPRDELGQRALSAAKRVKFEPGQLDHPLELRAEGAGDAFISIMAPVYPAESGLSTGLSSLATPEAPKAAGASARTLIGYVKLGVGLGSIQATTRQFQRQLGVVVGLLVLMGFLTYLALAAFVIRPLTRMAAVADKIASGDLTERVESGSHDEIGTLALSFNEMLEGLRALARELKMAGGQLGDAAAEIVTAAEEQSVSSREQSVSVNETTATMEELAQTSKQIAENSDRVARTAEETFLTAQTGSRAVEDTIAGMMSIKSQTESNTNKIFALGDKIQKIGNVVKIINDIADQTKLIAFNAAIEAAGAGEAGKRFSIVAVEVRRLADTVVESIEEIKNTITEIQLATNELILSSEKGIKDVEEGVNVASRGGESLQKIIAMIKHTTESAKQISLSTQQQRTASEQVVISMKEVSKTANQTASSSKQTIAIATELNSLSEQLASVVKRFSLAEGDGGLAVDRPARRSREARSGQGA